MFEEYSQREVGAMKTAAAVLLAVAEENTEAPAKDVVSQDELEILLRAHQAADFIEVTLRNRVMAGAVIEPGRLTFDAWDEPACGDNDGQVRIYCGYGGTWGEVNEDPNWKGASAAA